MNYASKKDIINFIISLIKKIKSHELLDSLDEKTKLSLLAIDSLDYTYLIIECEEEFDILLDDYHWETLDTIEDLSDYIYTLLVGKTHEEEYSQKNIHY